MITSHSIQIENVEATQLHMENKIASLTFLTYGGVVLSFGLLEDGECKSIVPRYENLDDYRINEGYLNALVGPFAGRIADGKYEVNGELHTLSKQGNHHLHGGSSGISHQVFSYECKEEKAYDEVTLHLVCDHSEDGFDGLYTYKITYRLQGSSFTIFYEVTPSQIALVNPTSHLYFNCAADFSTSVLNEVLRIPSISKGTISARGVPEIVEPIEPNGPFDFLKPRLIKEAMKPCEEFLYTKGYDAPFMLIKGESVLLYDETTRYELMIQSDAEAVVVYTANYFNEGMKLSNVETTKPNVAIALEFQNMPNGVNMKGVQDSIVQADDTHKQTTTYTITKR